MSAAATVPWREASSRHVLKNGRRTAYINSDASSYCGASLNGRIDHLSRKNAIAALRHHEMGIPVSWIGDLCQECAAIVKARAGR